MPRRLVLVVAFLAASATAAPAESPDGMRLSEAPERGFRELPPAEAPDGLRLPEALERTLRELFEELKPALDDAIDFMRSFETIDDPRNYDLPEILPNGDIIIRRRDDAPPFRPHEPERRLPLPGPREGIRT